MGVLPDLGQTTLVEEVAHRERDETAGGGVAVGLDVERELAAGRALYRTLFGFAQKRDDRVVKGDLRRSFVAPGQGVGVEITPLFRRQVQLFAVVHAPPRALEVVQIDGGRATLGGQGDDLFVLGEV